MNLSEQECPECGQDYSGLSIDSSREMATSVISCSECGLHFSGDCCEEDLIEQFKKTIFKPKVRKNDGKSTQKNKGLSRPVSARN